MCRVHHSIDRRCAFELVKACNGQLVTTVCMTKHESCAMKEAGRSSRAGRWHCALPGDCSGAPRLPPAGSPRWLSRHLCPHPGGYQVRTFGVDCQQADLSSFFNRSCLDCNKQVLAFSAWNACAITQIQLQEMLVCDVTWVKRQSFSHDNRIVQCQIYVRNHVCWDMCLAASKQCVKQYCLLQVVCPAASTAAACKWRAPLRHLWCSSIIRYVICTQPWGCREQPSGYV